MHASAVSVASTFGTRLAMRSASHGALALIWNLLKTEVE
jgi:hypothetical protein